MIDADLNFLPRTPIFYLGERHCGILWWVSSDFANICAFVDRLASTNEWHKFEAFFRLLVFLPGVFFAGVVYWVESILCTSVCCSHRTLEKWNLLWSDCRHTSDPHQRKELWLMIGAIPNFTARMRRPSLALLNLCRWLNEHSPRLEYSNEASWYSG